MGREERVVQVLGIPTEGKENFLKGVALAPAYIRWAFQSIEDVSPYQETGTLPRMVDRGDLPFVLEEADGRNRYDRLRELWPEGVAPPFLLLGGDHLITLVGVERARQTFPDLAVVHLDAHLDARPVYLGDAYTHATVMHHVAREVEGRVISVGVRSRAVEERVGWAVLEVEEARRRLESLKGPVYLSVDLDVFRDFPCVGNYEPGGLTFEDFLALLVRIPHLVAADVVEYNPLHGPPSCAAYAAVVFREILVRLGASFPDG